MRNYFQVEALAIQYAFRKLRDVPHGDRAGSPSQYSALLTLFFRRLSSLQAASGFVQSEQLVVPSADVGLAKPPQEPLRLFPLSITPIAIPIVTSKKTPRLSPKTVIHIIQLINHLFSNR